MKIFYIFIGSRTQQTIELIKFVFKSLTSCETKAQIFRKLTLIILWKFYSIVMWPQRHL